MQKLTAKQRGFTLIEVMIAMGLSAVVLLTVVQLMGLLSQGERNMMELTNEQALITLATTALQYPAGCLNTLQGIPITTAAQSVAGGIKNDSTPTITVVPNGLVLGTGQSAITVSGVTLSSVNAAAVSTTNAVPATVTINYTKSIGNGVTTPRSLALPVSVIGASAGAGAAVKVCYGATASANAVCAAFGTTLNPATGVCSQLCLNGYCRTAFNSYHCPVQGMSASCINMVGMTVGGIPECGQAPSGAACTSNCAGGNCK